MDSTKAPVEVVGIVHPLGVGGGRAGNETLWTLRFRFAAWRESGRPIEERVLIVARPGLSREEVKAAAATIKPHDIIRTRLRFAGTRDDPRGLTAELDELLGKDDSDTDLIRVAERLREPVTVEHPVLGAFTLDRRFDTFTAYTEWNGEAVQLSLFRTGGDDAGLFADAEGLWKAQKEWDRRIRDFAAAELLVKKNGLWLGEGEKKFTPRRFKMRMTLESIDLHDGGEFEFTFADGNLFWGHAIQVGGTIHEGVKYASLAG